MTRPSAANLSQLFTVPMTFTGPPSLLSGGAPFAADSSTADPAHRGHRRSRGFLRDGSDGTL